ncbi:helicase [Sphingopyxis lindanitolerans]|uniref:Helicase n=2 Tax=Sphingopyxis lindanitolerans TaxID=2054227 RepID=A0A2S8B312_9SPHN|nr:helicase [Sphingopyxis lindanitolerans]
MTGDKRLVHFPARYSIDGKLLKNPIRQLAREASHEEVASESVMVGRRAMQALVRADGSGVLLTDRRIKAPAEWGEVLLCHNLEAFLDGGTDTLTGEWISPQAAKPQAQDLTAASAVCQAVISAWVGAFTFREEQRSADKIVETGLRPPQVGALFGVLSHWKASSAPATVVMPTGTGKTETMLALHARERIERLLVIVPTGALRDQIGEKFLTMGLLKLLGALDTAAPLPVVGLLEHKPRDSDEVDAIFRSCNVVVTTMAIAGQCSETVQSRMAELCTHLFIDEAHHISARTWSTMRDRFILRHVVQFTATPFRNDGKHVDGKLVFNYPLRKAQSEGYFKEIGFSSVDEIDQDEADLAIAETAIAQLAADQAAGFKHLVMARCADIPRARKVHEIYQRLAPERAPVLLNNKVPAGERSERLARLRRGDSHIVVCVDMLGEGFDLPELKIAAIHDPHKSLAITLQFTGRFTRSRSDLGDATMIANIADPGVGEALQDLYAVDADWNMLLRDLSEGANNRQARRSEFLDAFQDVPDAVSLRNIFPKMSAVVYRTKVQRWRPEQALSVMGNTEIHAGPTINERDKVLLFITREYDPVAWGDVRDIRNTEWHLYLIHWDEQLGLLYINSSNKSSTHEELAQAVGGAEATIIKGERIFRSLHNVNRLVLTNLGLSDVINERLRFSLHVGSDITDTLPEALRLNKRKTNLFAHGYQDGVRVTVGCSQKGRVWSMSTAQDLAAWVDWCHAMGAKLSDEAISTANVFKNVILPVDVAERPALVALLIDWPEEFLKRSEDAILVTIDGEQTSFFDTELQITDFTTDAPIRFRIVTPDKIADYELRFTSEGVNYVPTGAFDAQIRIGRTTRSLGDWFRREPPAIRFANGGYLEGTELFVPPAGAGRNPFDRDRIAVWDWTGVDITKESQHVEKRADSIQRRLLDSLLAETTADEFPIIFDDDDAGEAADVVCIGVRDGRLVVRLYHCKFAGGQAGARVEDLYAVCGQAQRSTHWRGMVPELFKHLRRREEGRKSRMAKAGRAHVTRFERGDVKVLRDLDKQARLLMPEFKVYIVQPGLSKAGLVTRQLDLLAATDLYLTDTSAIPLHVIGSA